MFEKLKLFLYNTVDQDNECECEEHNYETPFQCDCCHECQLYYETVTMRNTIHSATTIEELRDIFQDDWYEKLEEFVCSDISL